ncbi:hypothetical protein BDZ94DRAFT_1160299 [Collybia nuda]|uniref:Uncharacterized protein n=1 Tax=Collybia nuda TaxID=64659 RepID=A0A9P5YAX0_9AGAR|nr:hypothetical protein BDZ94DRAFT_1160299 [Collybia nuda]
MSYTSSPLPSSGYASPIPSGMSTPFLIPKPSSSKPPPKPVNVFTNDGSFLERFQSNKKEGDEKKKELDALERKRNFDNRFRNRGKRPAPNSTPSSDSIIDVHPAKKRKSDNAISASNFTSASLKDTGTDIRPLIK